MTHSSRRLVSTMRHLVFVFAALSVAGLLVGTAAGQETQPQPALPDIAPRVVEIRGNLEISLPSLQRQPLVGFNPPPRVAPIPPDRLPYVEDYKQESIDLPPSPLAPPEPPTVASLIGGEPLNGLVEATAGRYLSRSLLFRSEWALTQAAAVYSRLDYGGAAGHTPAGSLDEASSSFDALDALVGVQHGTRWATLGLELDGFINRYELFGAQPASGFGDLRDEAPLRDGRGGGAAFWLQTQASSGVDLYARAGYGVATYETDAFREDARPEDNPFERDEASIGLESRLAFPLAGNRELLGDIQFTGSGFDGETVGANVTTLDGAAGLSFALGNALELAAQGRLVSFTASDSSSKFFAAPDLQLDFYPFQGVRLYASNDARAEHRTLATLLRTNPYVIDHPDVQPTVYTVDARAGGRLQVGVFEADVHAGYSRAPNFLYFERASTAESGGYVRGMIASKYDGAEIRYFGGDVSVNLPAGLHASAGVTFRDGQLVDDEVDIPYFGPVLGRGAFSYSFLDNRAYVKAGVTYEAARFVDVDQSRELGDYFDFDFDASYELSNGLALLLRLENLSDGFLERWERYDEAPFIFSAGVRARW